MPNFKDLAPMIHRQRLVIEGYPDTVIDDVQIRLYLAELSSVLKMKPLITPITHCSDKYGWAGWIHWENSGAHFYAWERPRLFFSVDIYTCKAFRPDDALRFTEDFFKARQIVSKEF